MKRRIFSPMNAKGHWGEGGGGYYVVTYSEALGLTNMSQD